MLDFLAPQWDGSVGKDTDSLFGTGFGLLVLCCEGEFQTGDAEREAGDRHRSEHGDRGADGLPPGTDGSPHPHHCTDRAQAAESNWQAQHSHTQVVEQCLELGAASAQYISGTMEDMAFAKRVVKEAETLLGGLDMLILNHVGTSYFGYFNGDVEHVRKLLEINFLSYVAMTTSALPMLKQSEGSVVVVSSMAGKVGFPFTVPYSATKFALDGFFSSLRQEFIIQNINVSITLCILGFIDTESAVRAAGDVLRVRPAPREECALEILKGAALRRRELYYRYSSTRLPLLLRDCAAELLDYLVRGRYRLDGPQRP
ncbi:11-beta-hydroxysteroid dehydrogenase 1-like isoform X1 [Melanerpes formicivorus]|uniref:11-beta-hydroxysteroid dehydrogenase 1-like isoform X1 n=1 Tax=Melanerpes formicivorus TaxID=211600 RepID=UPI00358F696F